MTALWLSIFRTLGWYNVTAQAKCGLLKYQDLHTSSSENRKINKLEKTEAIKNNDSNI